MPTSSFAIGVLAPNRNAELRASAGPLDSCFVLDIQCKPGADLPVAIDGEPRYRDPPKWAERCYRATRSWRLTGASSRVRGNSTPRARSCPEILTDASPCQLPQARRWTVNRPILARQDLKVRITGAKVEGYLNGKLYLEHTLPAPVSGKIGVWSKADSVVYFDDYRVVSAPQG